jgi:tetratricopeptide (TPR) repeat protein
LACGATLAGLTLTVLVFWPGLYGPFLLDDEYNIAPTRVSTLSWQELRKVTFSNDSGPLRRPISVLSFALNHYFTGPEAFGFKATNLVLHLINTFLLFWLGVLLLRRFSGSEESDTRIGVVCGVAALIWAIHPIQVSTVLYAVQRMAMLASTFSIAAILCYTILRQRLESAQSSIWLPGLLLGVFAVCAVLSKESGALIPFYLLAIELVVFRFRYFDAKARAKLYAVISVYAIVPIAIGITYFVIGMDAWLAGYAFREYTLGERLLTQPAVLWFYIKLILLPNVTEMSLFHDDFPIAQPGLWSLLQLAGIAALALAAVLFRQRVPVIALGILWFLASQLIESTVFPLELVFEHRNYLAAWGLLLAVSFYLIPADIRHSKQKMRIAATAIIVALFAFQTQLRAQTWSDVLVWTAITVREHPNSARAHHAYARLLSGMRKYAEATEHARRAEQLDDHNVGYTISVLLSECLSDEFSAVTVRRLENKLATRPLNLHTTASLHTLMEVSTKQRCPELDRATVLSIANAAVTDAERATPLQRSASLTFLALAQTRFPDKKQMAIETLREAHRSTPKSIMPLVIMGQLQVRHGQLDAARTTLMQAKQQNARNFVDQSHLLAELENTLEQLETNP